MVAVSPDLHWCGGGGYAGVPIFWLCRWPHAVVHDGMRVRNEWFAGIMLWCVVSKCASGIVHEYMRT